MTEDPAGDDLPLVREKYADRFRMDPNPPNTYWFFMNRDAAALRQARGAPGVQLRDRQQCAAEDLRWPAAAELQLPAAGLRGPGYEKIDPCPYGDPAGPPDLAKARQLVEQSGYKGMSVTVWGNSKDPRPAIADYQRDILNQIGFKAKTKILDQQVYFGTIGLKKTRAQTGFTDWFQDFPHPGGLLRAEPLEEGAGVLADVQLQLREQPQGRRGDREADAGGGPGDRRRGVGEARQGGHREREHRGLRQRAVDRVLLGPDGLRELLRRPPGVQDRLVAVLPEVAPVRHGGEGRSRRSSPHGARPRRTY